MMAPPPIHSQYGFMLGPVPSLGWPRKRGTRRLLLHIHPEIPGGCHTALGLPLSGRSLVKDLCPLGCCLSSRAWEHEKGPDLLVAVPAFPLAQVLWVPGQAHPTTGPLLSRTIKVEVYDWDRDGR